MEQLSFRFCYSWAWSQSLLQNLSLGHALFSSARPENDSAASEKAVVVPSQVQQKNGSTSTIYKKHIQ
jgi:hypothetical protein